MNFQSEFHGCKMMIFQRNLKRNTSVVIKNINNDKTIIAKVGANANGSNTGRDSV